METVDVIIPAYRPGKEFEKLLDSLSTQNYPVEKILVMNTEEKFWNTAWEKKFPKVDVVHLKKADLTTVEPDAGEQDCLIQILWYL